jgi:hypothetical protein
MTPDQADRLQKGLAGWAGHERSWRGLAVVGSWARGAARDDSDLDLMALVDDLGRWTADDGWLRDLLGRIGFTVAASGLEVYGVARSWRVWLGPGVELELGLADTSWACAQPLDPGTRRVVGQGMRPLVDKDRLLHGLEKTVIAAGQGVSSVDAAVKTAN